MVVNINRLKVYETFLIKVMKATQDYEKEDKNKSREALKKMIDRYELLKKKQAHLLKDTKELELKKSKQRKRNQKSKVA